MLSLAWTPINNEHPHANPNTKLQYDALWLALTSLPRLKELRVSMFMWPCEPVLRDRDGFNNVFLGPLDKLSRLLQLEVFDLAVPESFLKHLRERNGDVPYRVFGIYDRKLGGGVSCW
jgi:hypothetical protein